MIGAGNYVNVNPSELGNYMSADSVILHNLTPDDARLRTNAHGDLPSHDKVLGSDGGEPGPTRRAEAGDSDARHLRELAEAG